MSAYVVVSYRLTDPEAYREHPPAVVPTLVTHGAEILAADYESEPLEGDPPHVTVILRFPDADLARTWHQSAEHRDIAHLRTDHSEGTMVLAKGFDAPAR